MEHLWEVQAALENGTLAPLEAREELFRRLAKGSDRGVRAALEMLSESHNTGVRDYLTQYLELLPGARETKTQAARRLRHEPEGCGSAARLVPWLPEDLVRGFVEDYLELSGPGDDLLSVLYYIGLHFPELLRPVADRVDDGFTRGTLLSGAGDHVADRLLGTWRERRDQTALRDLAYLRTDRAREHVRSLRSEIEDPAEWETLLELAGELPDTGEPAGYRPTFRGFLVEAGASPHVVGSNTTSIVPSCRACQEPTTPLLRLSAASLPYELSADPEFFWYSCDCESSCSGDVSSLTARVGPDGPHSFEGPLRAADPEIRVTPGGELSMLLEELPNQIGESVPGAPGYTGHRVGGPPHWSEPGRHPTCPECAKVMPHLATMDSGRTPYGELTYDELLLCFWCDGCYVSSTVAQI
ncbi:hypothetical protein [Streptomyces oceani]|uniref:DUF1963 domain-containing protein n=1 Tax=Streptomyces oceani TaxID=1075402 RepID=A0A1E7KGL9_9ACTN|nr:hypothetical protein [Streptomyces oceani]OEV03092.1 hypothetical protein AN216_13315 [Streptomyces oceani]